MLTVVWADFARAEAREWPIEGLRRPGGKRVPGRLAGSLDSGFSFLPADGSSPLPLEPGSIVDCGATGADSMIGTPLFRVLAGEALRLSGTVRSISPTLVRLGVSWQGPEITLPRPGVQVVLQRPGVARVLVDNFESLEPARWTTTGKVSVVDEPRASERKSLRIPAGGASISHKLDESLAAGRLELAYHDDGAVAAGRRWSIELTFQGPSGASVFRVIPGWADESLAVEMPNGPALTVQHLARTPGWHRFMLRFGPEQTEISVDGKDLAHGKGPDGPLVALRFASLPAANDAAAPEPSKAPVCHLDDLQLTRFADPPGSFELDITQDETRLVVGDQVFGEVQKADSERVFLTVQGKAIALPWGQVSGLYFRRLAAEGSPVEGLLSRVEWRSMAGVDPASVDFADGAITAITDRAITVATPFSGTLAIPRDLLQSVVIRGFGRWYLIDATAHHLGDEVSTSAPVLDPPEPEGGLLERTINLPDAPAGSWSLVVDAVQVVREEGDEQYSERVKNGEFRTYAVVNDRRIDYLNRHIKIGDATPERVTMSIPAGVVHAGKNVIRLELTGVGEKSSQLDDLGVLQVALEVKTPPNSKGTGAPAGRP